MDFTERIDPVRGWIATLVAGIVALGGGALAFPGAVYDRFIWHYFWGPVYADAHNALCAVTEGGATTLESSTAACTAAVQRGAIVAEPGYTPVSEVGYMIVGLFFIVGVLLLLRRLNIGQNRELLYALVPFMLFGGALRVVEDANDALLAGGAEPFIGYPLNTLFISPLIYFTVFFLTLGAILGSIYLSRNSYIRSYHRLLAVIGTILLVLTFGYILFLSVTSPLVGFYPQILLLVLVLATAFAVGIYRGLDVFAPEVNRGTGYMGLIVLWSHAIDGVANVIASDWAIALGLDFAYSAKHPANRFIISVTEQVLPSSIATAIGTSWPFLLVKLVVATGIVWLFSEEFLEESPRYTILLLIAIAAVGLGPGTRDMIRATFGI